MPETAMHKDGHLCGAKGDVRPPREVSAMQPVPVAKSGENAPDNKFGLGVFAADGGHATGTLNRGENVSHHLLYDWTCADQ